MKVFSKGFGDGNIATTDLPPSVRGGKGGVFIAHFLYIDPQCQPPRLLRIPTNFGLREGVLGECGAQNSQSEDKTSRGASSSLEGYYSEWVNVKEKCYSVWRLSSCVFFLVFILWCLAAPIYAQHEKAGTTGFAFMKMNYSARAMGMANAFTAIGDDADAVFFNTAGLAHNNVRHLKTTYMNYIEGMQGGSISFVTSYNSDWKIAPFVQFMFSDAIPKTIVSDGSIIEIGTFHTSDILLGVGMARTLGDHLDVGFNVKYYYQKLDTQSASALAADISVMHQTQNENLKVGATLKNAGTQLTYFTENKYKEELPLMAIAGATYNVSDILNVNLDICIPFVNDVYGRIGAEYPLNESFTLRAGYDTRSSDYRTYEGLTALSGLAFGAGFAYHQYIIDYAAASMGALGLTHQISVSYKF